MPQQIIALIIIIVFVFKLISQKNRQEISQNELTLWLTFWSFAALAIILIKQLDAVLVFMGFSGSGINFLIYLSVLILFYLLFRLRLRLAKLDANLTELVRQITLNNNK